MTLRTIGLALAALVLAAMGSAVAQAKSPPGPATLWQGGTILTMDGDTPQTVQAVVERDGRIVFAGSEAAARRIAGRGAQIRNLKGATMLPGFVDAHSHFAMALQLSTGVDLDEASAPVQDIPSLITALKEGIAKRQIAPGGWVLAFQYREAQLAEKRHITRADLDAALPGYRIVLMHFTGHGLVASSAALEAGGVKDDAANPPGGLMLRDAAGKVNGVLFEQAMMPVALKLPQPGAEQKLAAFELAQARYARAGFTHMQDGATQLPDLAFFTSPEARARLKLDLALLPYHGSLDAILKREDLRFGEWQGHVKLQGIKFVLDGSPQARTAFMSRDYALGSPEGHHPWHGQPNISEAEWTQQARKVHARGWQLFVHANGDAAIDMAIRGFDTLGIKAADDRRPVVIHSQFQRADHLPAYARIGVGPAYFTGHTHYFADIHRGNFGPAVVDFISPLRSARQIGLTPSNHTDFPVTALDPMMMLWSSMARSSVSGVVSGPAQRLSAYQALQAITTGAAWQVFEENRKGRIKAGLLADFVVLDRNPLTTPVEQIRSIRVLETVKAGEVVWVRD
jgi:predicted amidohydrolase YtcJ